MQVHEAVTTRRSVRAFLPDPVPAETIRRAPVALFCSIDRRMGPPQWSDCGMYLQNVMLLLREEGLDSCAQECWALYPETVARSLDLPAERILFTGVAIGRADPAHPVNALRSARAPIEETVRFIGL